MDNMKWLLNFKDWFVSRTDTVHAKIWLAFFTFIEAIFFPIPVDPLLIGLILANSKKWLHFALITSASSAAGALVGYYLGLFFFNTFGDSLISFYGLHQQFEYTKELLNNGVFFFTIISAVTPIPFKVFVLAAGFSKVNLFLFILASLIGRGARYVIVAYLTHRFGSMSVGLLKRFHKETILFGIISVALYILYILFLA